MDQKSTNGNGIDKRNWRERLGIGTKDMPKISDEFKAQPALAVPPKSRAPQPVSRPAPMAPRAAPVKLAAPAEARKAPQPPPSDGLADKLRAQRAAAEKLAEQRVTAARERAESRSAAEPGLSISRPAPVEAAPKPAQSTAGRPKFTFADDETSIGRRELGSDLARSRLQRSASSAGAGGSLLPPRPALGGDRASLRSPSSSFRAEALPGYRPIDPATGYVPPSQRPTLGGQRPYSQDIPDTGYAERLPARPPAYDARRRLPPANPPYETEGYDDELRGEPRLGRVPASRGRARAYAEEPDDVFEDDALAEAPRRRASANDYQSAYREAEEGFEVDRRRSSGPWLLLLALLAAAVATGGIVWYYNTKMKTSSVATTAPATETVPVVAAPELPAKTVPEPATEPAIEAASVNKKQIYDRIVGDQEVLGGQMVPTEVTPVQPEVQPTAEQGAAQVPQPADATGQATEEPLPLPLPPPPGDDSTQGQLEPGTDQSVAAAAEPVGSELKSKTTTVGQESIKSLLPPPDATGSAADTTQAAAPSDDQPAADTSEMVTDPEPEVAKPAAVAKPTKKKAVSSAKATAKSKKSITETDAATGSGVEPVVLVPPGEVAAPSQAATDSAAPLTEEPVAPAPKKKKTLFDLFKKSDTSEPAADVAAPEKIVNVEPAPEAVPVETKVASLPAAKTEAAPSGGGGYVVQLASFRSEAEAQAEYQRLKFKYPSLIGPLPSRIAQATVAGSTRYRLGVGPLASKDEATKVCGNLFAAGERDCLVRTP